MSYRTKPVIYGNRHSREAKPGQNFVIMGACLGMMAPGFGRMLANTGWVANTELLVWGSIAAGFVCIAGGMIAGVHARRRAALDIEEMIHG